MLMPVLAQALNERGAPIIAEESADAEKGTWSTARRLAPAYLGSDPSLKAILRHTPDTPTGEE